MAEYEKFESGIVLSEGLGAVPDLSTKAVQASQRHRDTYTFDEVNLFDRFAEMIRKHGDRISITCGGDTCPSKNVKLANDPTVETGAVLRCGCTDRVFERSKVGDSIRSKAAARRAARNAKRLKRVKR